MSKSTASKLLLLADQTQIAINERNRMKHLGLDPSADEEREILNSFETLHDGMQALQDEGDDRETAASIKKRAQVLDTLKANYKELLGLYRQDESVDAANLDLKLTPRPAKPPTAKHVRFRENLVDEHEPHPPGLKPKPIPTRTLLDDREELFIKPYRDNPDEEEEERRTAAESSLTSRGGDLDDNEHFQLQQDTMQDQDSHLDRLALSVSRQHQLSLQISGELDSHLELLDEVDNYTENSQGRLATARRRLDKFSRKAKNNGSLLTIAILFLVFIILLIVLK